MNAQKILDNVTNHLFTQKVASMTEIVTGSPICAYRGKNGTSCAIGCLIPDDNYKSSMEHKSVRAVCLNNNYDVPGFVYSNVSLLMALQNVHDNEMPRYKVDQTSDTIDVECHRDDMKRVATQIRMIASDYLLKYPVHLIPEQYHPV